MFPPPFPKWLLSPRVGDFLLYPTGSFFMVYWVTLVPKSNSVARYFLPQPPAVPQPFALANDFCPFFDGTILGPRAFPKLVFFCFFCCPHFSPGFPPPQFPVRVSPVTTRFVLTRDSHKTAFFCCVHCPPMASLSISPNGGIGGFFFPFLHLPTLILRIYVNFPKFRLFFLPREFHPQVSFLAKRIGTPACRPPFFSFQFPNHYPTPLSPPTNHEFRCEEQIPLFPVFFRFFHSF